MPYAFTAQTMAEIAKSILCYSLLIYRLATTLLGF